MTTGKCLHASLAEYGLPIHAPIRVDIPDSFTYTTVLSYRSCNGQSSALCEMIKSEVSAC